MLCHTKSANLLNFMDAHYKTLFLYVTTSYSSIVQVGTTNILGCVLRPWFCSITVYLWIDKGHIAVLLMRLEVQIVIYIIQY